MLLPDISCLLLAVIAQASAQSGTTVTGDSYVCVPAGFCNNNGSPSSPGIDPRIVTPGTGVCPPGQVACYTQGPGTQCGNRFVQQTSTVDGPADPAAYPWLAYIRNATHLYAGAGVLLNNYYVLTAAHKVFNSPPASVVVFMGVYDPTQIGVDPNIQNRTAQTIITHPNYNPGTLMNDLAIIRVAQPFALSSPNINTACLPPAGTSYVGPAGTNCVVAGWGQTAFQTNDAPTNPMKQVYVNVVDYNTCRASYASASQLGANVDVYLDPSGEICAGGQPMRDACTYDGGAPLICPGTGKGYIAGLVIWGKNCGQPGVYGVYVNVPAYRDWIDTNIQLNG